MSASFRLSWTTAVSWEVGMRSLRWSDRQHLPFHEGLTGRSKIPEPWGVGEGAAKCQRKVMESFLPGPISKWPSVSETLKMGLETRLITPCLYHPPPPKKAVWWKGQEKGKKKKMSLTVPAIRSKVPTKLKASREKHGWQVGIILW